MELRTCKTCGESKPLLTEYYLSGPNYRIPHCKDCYAKKKGTKRVKSWGKECIQCKETKPIAKFGKEKKRGPKAVFDTCKECRDKAKAVPEGHKRCGRCKEIKLIPNFSKQISNKDGLNKTCRQCVKEKNARDFNQNKNSYLIRTYGITLEQYNIVLDRQEGTCAIPSCVVTPESHGKMLFVDHIHDHCSDVKGCLACVRGLLCVHHNWAIGYAKDDPIGLRECADYAESNYRPFVGLS